MMKKLKLVFCVLSIVCLISVSVSYSSADVLLSESQEDAPVQMVSYNCDTGDISYSDFGNDGTNLNMQTYTNSGELSAEGYAGDASDDLSLQDLLASDVQPMSIIGADYRFRVVTPNNHNSERKICHLTAYYDRDSDGVIDDTVFCGTGFLIGPSTIMTCAHIVFSKSNYLDASEMAMWCKYVDVRVARDGDSMPYGTQRSTTIHLATGWISNLTYSSSNYEYDWAIIELDDDVGNSAGWLGKQVISSPYTVNSTGGQLCGYPGDKPFGTMWYSTGGLITRIDGNRLYHAFDTTRGSSGAPIYSNGMVCAINNTSPSNQDPDTQVAPDGSENGAVRITSSLYQKMETFRPASLEYTDGKSFRLRNVGSGKYLDIANGADANGTNALQYTSNGAINQRFKLERISTGSQIYLIRAMCSSNGTNRVLDIKRSGGAISAGQNVQIWTAVDPTAQQWMLFEVESGKYRIMPKEGTRYALAAVGSADGSSGGTSSSSAGNVCIVQYDGSNPNHLWEIVDVS